MSNELHVGAYVDTFKAFPSAAFAIALSPDPRRVGPLDRSDQTRTISISEELIPDELAELRYLAAEFGRVCLIFDRWELFSHALRAFRSAG